MRTPAEFDRAHIPGAINLPLFSNDERAVIGTLYKQVGSAEAIKKGLELTGPKMRSIVETTERYAEGRGVAVHCWRGGKRSESVAWLLGLYGLDVIVLDGGYKRYRNHVLEQFKSVKHQILVLGGRTGTRKTDLLHKMRELGEQVLDLEGLANHKGSAFGWIGENPQPYSEHFENMLYHALDSMDLSKPVWIENESRAIGKVRIPDDFWAFMKRAPLINIEIPHEKRLDHLTALYASGDNKDALIEAFTRITKRLGGQNVKLALEALNESNYRAAADIALRYYDKTYDYNLSVNRAPQIVRVQLDMEDLEEDAKAILKVAESLNTVEQE